MQCIQPAAQERRPAVLTVIRVPLGSTDRGLGAARGAAVLSLVDESTAAREGRCVACSVIHLPGSTAAEPGRQNSPAVS